MPKQILIVDDEVSILKLLNFILKDDFELEVKTNGAEALAWLDEGHYPDLIISDMEMPFMNGETFMYCLKSSGFFRDIPVIMLSGAEDLESIVGSFPFEVTFFTKPFNPLQLKSAVTNVLSSHTIGTPV
jgi:DNA-binding NtrC family response regulator